MKIYRTIVLTSYLYSTRYLYSPVNLCKKIAKLQNNCKRIKLWIFLCQNVFSTPYQKFRKIQIGENIYFVRFYTPLSLLQHAYLFNRYGCKCGKRTSNESVVIPIMHQTNLRTFIFQIIKTKYTSSLNFLAFWPFPWQRQPFLKKINP